MQQLQLSSEDPEGYWTVFQNAFHSSAFDTLGHKSRKHQDWFDENDEEIQDLVDDKYRLHKAHQDDTSPVSTWAAYNSVGHNTFLSRPHLCFIIVFICDLFLSRDDPLMS